MKRRSRPWRRRLGWGMALLGLCGALCVAALYGAGTRNREQLVAIQTAHAAIRATGAPTNLSEAHAHAAAKHAPASPSQPRDPVPVPEPKTPYNDLKDLPKADPRTRLTDGQRERLVELLRTETEALRVLLAGVDRGFSQAVPGQDWEAYRQHTEQALRAATASRVLAAEVLFAADAGESGRAVMGLLSMLGLSEALRAAPLAMSQHMHTAIRGDAAQHWIAAMGWADFSEAELARMQSALAGHDHPDLYADLLAYQRAETMVMHGQFGGPGAALRGTGLLSWFTDLGFSFLGVYGEGSDAMHLRTLDHMRRLIDLAELPYPDRVDAAREFESQFDFADPVRSAALGIADSIGSGLARMATTIAEDDAHLRAAIAATAVARHRLAHGTPPDRLDQLVPHYLAEVPADPFDGQPLRYRPTESGFVVYSIGPNGQDDGGDPLPSWRDGDIVVEVRGVGEGGV